MCSHCKNELVLELLDRAIAYSYDKEEDISEVVDEIAYAYEVLSDVVEFQDYIEYSDIEE